MILYQLRCNRRHTFEGWFKSIDTYDRQAKRGLIECPVCGSKKVDKAPMAPRLAKSGSRPPEPVPALKPPSETETETATAPEQQREFLKRLRKARDEVLAKSEYVGPRFAEEARRIHHNESETRGIHGEASPDEVRKLAEEGVEVHPVPVLPDDHN